MTRLLSVLAFGALCTAPLGAMQDVPDDPVGTPVFADALSYDLGVAPDKEKTFPLPGGIKGTVQFFVYDKDAKTMEVALTVPEKLRAETPEGYSGEEFEARYVLAFGDSCTYWIKPAKGYLQEFITVSWQLREQLDGTFHLTLDVDHWRTK